MLHSQATKQPHAYRHAAVEDLKKTKIDIKTWQTLALDRKQWRVAIAQGVRAITADWEGRQAAERETQHAYNDQNAVQRLFLEPALQRTSRADNSWSDCEGTNEASASGKETSICPHRVSPHGLPG